jgi:hydroxymethylglutaryl-CoA lyase
VSNAVRIVEVGPRDGLQNEPAQVATATKIRLIERLVAAGLRSVEATSFVSPRWVPQMADAAQVMAGLTRQPGVSYPVLVPNIAGYERALAAGATEIAVFGAASEAFSRRNINASIDESIERFRPVAERAGTDGIRVRGYVSTVLGCPYQGPVPVSDVIKVAQALHGLGCYEISLGDTIGAGTPGQARQMVDAVAEHLPISQLAVHFHDTRGQALANVFACLERGIRVVDASVAGLGGCPYAEGASGNVATEDLTFMLHGLGFETGVDLDALIATGRWICAEIGRGNGAKVGLAGALPGPQTAAVE